MVMATLGTLQPFWLLVCGSYFVLLYVGLSIWKDPTVGWPPAPSFVLPCASLAVTATISVWLAGLHHRNHRTEFKLRMQLSEAFSNLQQTQAQLLATEKALSQSQIVAALSHELNNPLGVVLANLSTQTKLSERLLKQWKKESPSSANDVGSLLSIHQELNQGSIKAAQRISNLVGRLREFSHLDRSETRMIDLNDELMKNLQIIRSEIATPIEVQTDLDPTVPMLLCQPQKLGLAFAGLLRNAFKAVGSSGTVRVSTSLNNEQVSVLIEDDGCGINPTELKTLFDPKFIPQSGKVTTS
jgi:signal transduction histidine kinase